MVRSEQTPVGSRRESRVKSEQRDGEQGKGSRWFADTRLTKKDVKDHRSSPAAVF